MRIYPCQRTLSYGVSSTWKRHTGTDVLIDKINLGCYIRVFFCYMQGVKSSYIPIFFLYFQEMAIFPIFDKNVLYLLYFNENNNKKF